MPVYHDAPATQPRVLLGAGPPGAALPGVARRLAARLLPSRPGLPGRLAAGLLPGLPGRLAAGLLPRLPSRLAAGLLPGGLGVAGLRLGVASRARGRAERSEEHTSELQSRPHLVCRLLLEKKNT